MAPLSWTTQALALTKQAQRNQMAELFEAFLRAASAEPQNMPSLLPLDLPTENISRWRYYARRVTANQWTVEARRVRPDLDLRFSAPSLVP